MAVNSLNDSIFWNHIKGCVIKATHDFRIPGPDGGISVVTLLHAQRTADGEGIMKFEDILKEFPDKYTMTVDGETSFLSRGAFNTIKAALTAWNPLSILPPSSITLAPPTPARRPETGKIELIPLGQSMNIRNSKRSSKSGPAVAHKVPAESCNPLQ